MDGVDIKGQRGQDLPDTSQKEIYPAYIQVGTSGRYVCLSRTASERGGHIGLMAFPPELGVKAVAWNLTRLTVTGLSTFHCTNYAARRRSRRVKEKPGTLHYG